VQKGSVFGEGNYDAGSAWFSVQQYRSDVMRRKRNFLKRNTNLGSVEKNSFPPRKPYPRPGKKGSLVGREGLARERGGASSGGLGGLERKKKGLADRGGGGKANCDPLLDLKKGLSCAKKKGLLTGRNQ